MKLISPLNEINYGSYDEGLDWNIQNYQDSMNLSSRKFYALFCSCLRINIFTPKLQAEIELLKSSETLRILLIGYDLKHDVYLEKSWTLTRKQFTWEGSPEKYEIQGRSLGLELHIQCDGPGALHVHFSYFTHYYIHFISHIHRADRKPLRNVNPFDFDNWSFNEKHAMLDCSSIELILDGNHYSQQPGSADKFNISYEWLGGHFPAITKELRCQFWQYAITQQKFEAPTHIHTSALVTDLAAEILTEEEEYEELDSFNLQEQGQEQTVLPQPNAQTIEGLKTQEMAGALLMMGHDSCSSESAVWVEQKIRYRLPRIIPTFGRSEQMKQSKQMLKQSKLQNKNSDLLPDLEWKITAGKHLYLSFQPFSVNDASKQAFPLTQNQRLYGFFYGKLFDQFGDAVPIRKALGFIDYRQIQWRKN